jgi:hypothetical protein
LAKVSQPKPKEEVDYEAILAVISDISEEMAEKVIELKKQFTTVKPAAAERKPALRVQDETPENAKLKEGIGSDILSIIGKFVSSFTSWIKSLDTQIAAVEKKIDSL